jgi:predicted dehydrogenase
MKYSNERRNLNKELPMKAAVIGLGSMGKRRIRCLHALGVRDIVGLDFRPDRCTEARETYGVSAMAAFSDLWQGHRPDFAIISLPPKQHVPAMMECLRQGVPFFVEASVVDDGLDEVIDGVIAAGLLAAPSSTLHFHPAIRKVGELVRSGRLGQISNVMLHSGQYLPDWHIYEKVSDYYVSDPVTGGAREIVPFELTWFTEVFGFPRRVAGNHRKTIEIAGAEAIDDTYNALLDYENFLASLTVDVVSRHATRRLTINGSRAQLTWSWDEPVIRLFDGDAGTWSDLPYEVEESAPGYNKNISESMYVDEIRAFLDALAGRTTFPNTLQKDHEVLRVLYALEESDRTGRFVDLQPGRR